MRWKTIAEVKFYNSLVDYFFCVSEIKQWQCDFYLSGTLKHNMQHSHDLISAIAFHTIRFNLWFNYCSPCFSQQVLAKAGCITEIEKFYMLPRTTWKLWEAEIREKLLDRGGVIVINAWYSWVCINYCSAISHLWSFLYSQKTSEKLLFFRCFKRWLERNQWH